MGRREVSTELAGRRGPSHRPGLHTVRHARRERSVIVQRLPEHQEFGILGHLTPGQDHQAGEQTAREQVDAREDHSGMISARKPGQARASNRAPRGGSSSGRPVRGPGRPAAPCCSPKSSKSTGKLALEVRMPGAAPARLGGWVAASVTALNSANRFSLSWLRAWCPVAILDGTILIYHFSRPPVPISARRPPPRPAPLCPGQWSSAR
jgi:hypothetical protein